MEELLISCTDLCKNYGSGVVLNNLELNIGRGRIVGLLGPNGTGKTTLIKLLCGLLQPTSGSVAIAGMKPGPAAETISANRKSPGSLQIVRPLL